MNHVVLGLGLAVAIAAIAELLRSYPRLPASMPLHFDLQGRPQASGPRALFVVIFAALTMLLAAALIALSPTSTPRESIVALALGFLAFVQHLIVRAAQRQDGRLAMRPVWFSFTILLALVACAVLLW